MPLLKRKAFEKAAVSEYLRDDDEVFHCEVTDEIFKDYEEYCERIILVNSMVWSCEMTGKINLTYAEALESEKKAVKSLKDFPMDLRTPILFLASKTNRCSFAEMSEDVFNYVRERFFIGEMVEACLQGDSWVEAHVLAIVSPVQPPGSKSNLPALSYCYEVEQLVEDSSAAGQICTIPSDQIRRRKGVYTRDKNRLFLKQFVQQSPGGIVTIKKVVLEKYNIAKVNFEQIFTGPIPEFPSSKKLMKNSLSPVKTPNKQGSASKAKKLPASDKKGQTSMDKFVKKTERPEASKQSEAAKKSSEELSSKMREAREQIKQKKLEEKESQKEKNARLQAYVKEWQRVKDDLELEDHKIIPKGTPIELEGIPQSSIGDLLSVLEFVHLYADNLKVKDVFHNGLDIEMLRKALVLKEHAGVFSDLVMMLLSAIFVLQEDEAEEYKEGGGIKNTEIELPDSEQVMGMIKSVELATKACKWSQAYLGTPLKKLPLDPTTVSEVLRLHLLSSGAEVGNRCALWRYQQRGGYSGHDDAGLWLRRSHPIVLRKLRTMHVADLSVDEKFKILQCLMNQILSYATIRDIIEEKLETLRITKHELRMTQAALRRHDNEQVSLRTKLRKEFLAKKEELKMSPADARANDADLKVALENLAKEGEVKKGELAKKVRQLQAQCFDFQSYLGSDRGYRRYWLNQCVAGVFVEASDDSRGDCRHKPVLPTASTDDTLTYVHQLFNKEKANSDKENDSAANSRGNSPKKPLTNLNGLTQKLNSIEDHTQTLKDLYVCTANVSTCPIHGKEGHPQWMVYNTEEEINALIQSLNKRGLRENELKHNLEMDKNSIVEYIKKCPMHLLNPAFEITPQATHSLRQRKFQPSITVPPDCSLSEALELSLRDYILELEDKIFHGCLGVLKVKDREAWRGTIMLRGYDKQAAHLSWGPSQSLRDDNLVLNGDIAQDLQKIFKTNTYRDPGYYLNEVKVNGVKTEAQEQSAPQDVITGLTSALLQVSQSIHHKYIKRPLGLDDKERKDREARGRPLDLEALERWEVSLMESKSFAQIVLHLFTLDSSITWSASILNASCRICRRKADPDNMLLCDTCNKGHHLYCLKPKLSKVPEGDWFCDQCKPKEERTPRKRRKLFSDQDMEEAMKSDSSEEEEEEEEEEDEDECSGSEASSIDVGVCAGCGSGGRLGVGCDRCDRHWHAECAPAARGTCPLCAKEDESDDNVTLVKLKVTRGRRSKEASPQANGVTNGHAIGRQRKSKEATPKAGRKSQTSTNNTPLTNGHSTTTNKRKRSNKTEPALHTDALTDLLRDVTKHRDSWPFVEPVTEDEVPDYFQVIQEPMAFATIKAKLEEGSYSTDEQFMKDAGLVFTNCYMYNKESDMVAKAGIRLQKYFNKRCSELELPDLSNIKSEDYHEEQTKPKKTRTSK